MKLQSVALAAATVVVCARGARASEYEVAPLTVAADKVEKNEAAKGKQENPIRVGAYAAAGFPSPLSVGAMIMIDRRVSLGAEYGFLPVSQVMGLDVTYRSISADARWFPFREAPLFLGLRAGRQSFTASKTVTVSGYGSYTGSTASESWYLNPRIGLFRMWDSGIFVGADVGLKIPIAHSETSEMPYGHPLPETIASVRDFLATKTIPTVTLLQLGVAF